MYIDRHSIKWDELHQMDVFRPLYPTESIVRFIKANFPNPANAHILDLGCGAGRHVLFLAEQGYKVTGIDFSQQGLDIAKKRIEEKRLHAQLSKGSILSLPFQNESFDGIISYGVLIYFKKKDLITAIDEIHRVLNKGGKAFIVVRSIYDKRFGLGKEIEQNTFRMKNKNEENFIVHFFTKEEILSELFTIFSKIELGFTNEDLLYLDLYNSNFLITLTK